MGKSLLSFWPTAVAIKPGLEPAESPIVGGGVSMCALVYPCSVLGSKAGVQPVASLPCPCNTFQAPEYLCHCP